jgi:hypothetical protein
MRLELVAFTPRARVVLTEEEIETMIACSALHYDGVCQAAGKRGGFLYGMKNRYALRESAKSDPANIDQSDATHFLEWSQIDTLLKILEVPPPGRVPIAASLTMEFGRLLTTLSNFTDFEWRPRR